MLRHDASGKGLLGCAGGVLSAPRKYTIVEGLLEGENLWWTAWCLRRVPLDLNINYRYSAVVKQIPEASCYSLVLVAGSAVVSAGTAKTCPRESYVRKREPYEGVVGMRRRQTTRLLYCYENVQKIHRKAAPDAAGV